MEGNRVSHITRDNCDVLDDSVNKMNERSARSITLDERTSFMSTFDWSSHSRNTDWCAALDWSFICNFTGTEAERTSVTNPNQSDSINTPLPWLSSCDFPRRSSWNV